jgi:hypothetical protein
LNSRPDSNCCSDDDKMPPAQLDRHARHGWESSVDQGRGELIVEAWARWGLPDAEPPPFFVTVCVTTIVARGSYDRQVHRERLSPLVRANVPFSGCWAWPGCNLPPFRTQGTVQAPRPAMPRIPGRPWWLGVNLEVCCQTVQRPRSGRGIALQGTPTPPCVLLKPLRLLTRAGEPGPGLGRLSNCHVGRG